MIKIDLQEKVGQFKPINGIDNGPVTFGSLTDSSRYYKQAGFPHCRLHDTNWPHPREVDVPTIFRDFSADENDPGNYDFRTTDIYLNEILATGAKIIYRLGSSIEHTKLKHHVHPPTDFDKWAGVCLNIARHCNEGWAGGSRMGIEYWEVWNEPDLCHPVREDDAMWSGTMEQYFALYAATSRLFKREMPGVKIGGYAAARPLADYCTSFLQYVRANDLPLDFFSWHIYTDRTEILKANAEQVRRTLDGYGFSGTEIILDEWNRMEANIWEVLSDRGPGGAARRRDAFAETMGETGAAFTAAALIEMLDMPIDIATFYDGSPTNLFGTIFDRYGVPTKQYYAFDAFNRLKQTGERVKTECGADGLYATASASPNNEKISILIANDNGPNGIYAYDIEGLKADGKYLFEVYLTDKHRVFDKAEEKVCAATEIPKSLYMYQHSLAFITLTKK